METRLKCVLLIDDDQITNFLNKSVLVDSGVAQGIEVAESVASALELLKADDKTKYLHPELIFLDLNMPGLNGWDFIDEYKLQKEKYGLNSVIIVLTTSANPDDRRRATEIREIREFRNKPLTQAAINDIIQTYFSISE